MEEHLTMLEQLKLLMTEPWKRLIVLDACRFDVFNEVCLEEGYGNPIECWSPAFQTVDWYKHGWPPDLRKETILISASPVPWIYNFYGSFCRSFLVKTSKQQDYFGLPTVEETLLEAEKRATFHPDSRFLIHLIPPHLPFYGPQGQTFLRKTFGIKKEALNVISTIPNFYGGVEQFGRSNGWDELRGYYREAIEVALETIFRRERPQNTVVTSDHGELIGEYERYGHWAVASGQPKGHTVPWL